MEAAAKGKAKPINLILEGTPMSWSMRLLVTTCAVLLVGPTGFGQEAKGPTAEQALKMLKEGNSRFVKEPAKTKEVTTDKRKELAKGQNPFAIILACADSRVAPELVFNQGLGDIFVLRVAGNVSDPFLLGSIEYGVEHLHVPLVVVLGHEKCGAVDAALSGARFKGNLGLLISSVEVGKDLPKERSEALAAAIRNNARHQASLLTRNSDVVREHVENKGVRVVSGVYRLGTGEVEWLEAK
jgi:carbonic anhydrase